jgi:UDP-N-acetylmuramoyl-L-alanyl-D-glutamate--2,6-diaminopimelate ligase
MNIKKLLKKFLPEPLILFYHKALVVLANLFYRFPSRHLIVIGVTGTNGKTTTCNIIWQILTKAGFKTGLATSINFKIGEKSWVNRTKQGMQGRFRLQRLLRQMVRAGCEYAVIETTSEGIKQYRHWGIDYNAAVFTNLTPEHIETHGSFENYKKAKGRLFGALKGKGVSIVNLDDEHAAYFLSFPANEKWVFGIKSQASNIQYPISNIQRLTTTDHQLSSKGAKFTVELEDQKYHFKTQLLGEFNIYNCLAAIAVGLSQKIKIEVIQKALEKMPPVSGRMEVIYDKKRDLTVIVDYAHDPAALENVYKTLHETCNMKHETNIIAVLGAVGGGRDKAKRPKLGALASQYAKYVIVTNEDPYDDDPMEIINQVEQGVKADAKRKINHNYWKILDRKQAIKAAIDLSAPGDLIALTGKGCEEVMATAKGFIPWDDRKVARGILLN